VEKRSYVWKPIQLWEGPWVSDGLALVFESFRKQAGEAVYQEFLKLAVREWSISTGEIEGAYDIGRGATETMLASGLAQNLIPKQRNGLSEERVYQILIDHRDTLEGLFEFIKSERPLTVSDIRQFHQTLMSSVDEYEAYFLDPSTQRPVPTKLPLGKGKFKAEPNNPKREDGSIHEYCPPHEVDEEMRRLVELFEIVQGPADVRAAWLHHAFSQIHPFQDGNGRVARVLASFVLITSGLAPLTVTLARRNRYLNALEAADHGDTKLLVQFFASCQYRQAVRLWHLMKVTPPSAVERGASLEEILKAAGAKLAAKHDLLPSEWAKANEILAKYRKRSAELLLEYGNAVHAFVRTIKSEFSANPGHTSFPAGNISVAWNEEWGEGFSLGEVPAEVLGIETGTLDQVIVGFDSFSPHRKGLCGVFVALRRGEVSARLGDAYFIHFASEENIVHFEQWLRPLIQEALRMWQEKLG
jgi:Fic family protein